MEEVLIFKSQEAHFNSVSIFNWILHAWENGDISAWDIKNLYNINQIKFFKYFLAIFMNVKYV